MQLRRYAWSAGLPLSLLTDFEELAVYGCRSEPQQGDGPAVARPEFFTYDRYPEPSVWDAIFSAFSRDAVLDGSLEKYAEKNKRRRGTDTVDAAFLREIESWRDARACSFAVQMSTGRDGFPRRLQFLVADGPVAVSYAGASPRPSHSSRRSLSQVVRRRFAAILAGMSSG